MVDSRPPGVCLAAVPCACPALVHQSTLPLLDLHATNTNPTYVAHCLAAGVSLSLTVASLAATTALLVYVRRQRQQLALLQRERSASFTSFQLNPSFSVGGSGPSAITVVDPAAAADGKLATLHTFNAAAGQAAAGQAKHPKLAKALSIIPTWTDEHSGYIQVSGGSRRAVSQGSGEGLLPTDQCPGCTSVLTTCKHAPHLVQPNTCTASIQLTRPPTDSPPAGAAGHTWPCRPTRTARCARRCG